MIFLHESLLKRIHFAGQSAGIPHKSLFPSSVDCSRCLEEKKRNQTAQKPVLINQSINQTHGDLYLQLALQTSNFHVPLRQTTRWILRRFDVGPIGRE